VLSVSRTERKRPAKPPDSANIDLPRATFRPAGRDLPRAPQTLARPSLSEVGRRDAVLNWESYGTWANAPPAAAGAPPSETSVSA